MENLNILIESISREFEYITMNDDISPVFCLGIGVGSLVLAGAYLVGRDVFTRLRRRKEISEQEYLRKYLP